MRDLDTAFTELRNDIAAKTVGPPVPELSAKARRRRRRKIAAVAVAAVVAVGGFLLPQSNGKQGAKPVISDTISPQPNSDRLVLKPARLTVEELLYGREVENNGWQESDESQPDSTLIPYVPSCDKPAPASRMTWFWSVDDASTRGEQLVQFDSPYAAQQWLIKMTANRSCAVEFHRLAGGDDSFSAEAKAEKRTAVVVRQRSTVAIYWHRESNAAAFAREKADALTMAERLCDRGYCTEPVTVKIPPATTLIHEKEWTGKDDLGLINVAKLGTDIGTAYALYFLKDPGGGAYRVEELLVAKSPEAAKQALATLVENNRTAKAQTRTEPRDIGDEAWYLRAHFTHDDGTDDEQFEEIIVRQGNAIAIYAQKSDVVPVSKLESEARTITERLKALGY